MPHGPESPAQRPGARDRDDAITDLAETQRGDFTKAKGASKSSGGDSQLGGIGSIFSSFLGETFGFGSFFDEPAKPRAPEPPPSPPPAAAPASSTAVVGFSGCSPPGPGETPSVASHQATPCSRLAAITTR